MIKLFKVDEKIDKIAEIIDYENIYKLTIENKTIGYGTINKDIENKIYIFIKEELRGNGYGKILFGKILEEIKKEGFENVRVLFNRENVQMIKIIENYGGKHLSTLEDSVKYMINV